MPSLRLPAIFSIAAAGLLMLASPLALARTVVEYYNATLDHYFVTAYANEISALDAGTFAGWVRTGQTFQVFDAGDSRLAGSSAVCRFYGNPARGLDSHFYSASPQECQDVKTRFPESWLIESEDVFRVHPANGTTGQCPVNTKAVYRLYNGRPDVNHRYTTDATVVDRMLAKGYTLEGIGAPRPIVFCAADIAPGAASAGTPVCTLTTSTQFPVLGTPVSMTASCTGSPTTYAWINCPSHLPTCTATSNDAGPVVYGIVASNANGPGNAATVTLNWQAQATEVPTCSLTASDPSPLIGSPLTLTAACNADVARYEWLTCSALTPEACTPTSECANATTSCSPVGRQQGAVLYSLRASNNAGTGPKASVGVTWRAPTTAPPPPAGTTPACVLIASSNSPAVNSTLTLTASCTNAPTAFTWSGCTSSTAVCTTTESTVGARTYRVTASNASGSSAPATVTVAWQVPPTQPPSCTLSANPSTVYAGATTILTANCTQSPSSYQFTNCSAATGNTCQAANASTGSVTYSVTATNALGTSAPASLTLNWQTPPPTGTDFCGNYPNVKRINLVWGGNAESNDPGGGFTADTVLVGRIRVPSSATASSQPGLISAVEYIGSTAQRIMTLSPSACDFRGFQPGVSPPTDSTGSTNPIAWSFGINPNIFIMLSGQSGSYPKLIPGQTYYVNIRNRNFTDGQPSCPSVECNMRVTVNPPR